jgi:hypothetical protein
VAHAFQEQAFVGLSGNNGRSMVAALDQAVAVIDTETAAGIGIG